MAEELLQAAFVSAVEDGSDIEDANGAVRWFYRVLRNAVFDHYRSSATEERALSAQARQAPSVMAPEIERSPCLCVHDVIATLKPEYGAILREVDLEARTLTAFAHEIGITPNNAAVRLHRARRALKARLVPLCGACAEDGCLDCTCRSGPVKLAYRQI
jgi:RNA polymerase sigma-70 factor (ECF subfamily)